jgi:hypothetical protein
MEQGQPETRQTRLRSVTPTLRAPTKLQNDVFAIERHNDLESRDVSKGSPRSIASRWILSCFSKLLCISIAMTKFCTRGDRITIDSVKVGPHAFNHATRIGPIPRPRPESRHCPSSSPGFRTTIASFSHQPSSISFIHRQDAFRIQNCFESFCSNFQASSATAVQHQSRFGLVASASGPSC